MPTRERILDAAAHVLHTRGLARATTKEIAKQAGYSEATLYKHFDGKSELFLAVLRERVPSKLIPLLDGLQERAGDGALHSALEEVAAAALDFYGETFPMAASLFSEPTLLAAHRQAVARRGAGPEHVNHALAAYLRAEQEHGRIKSDADPEAAAASLVGACMQHAFLRHFAGQPADKEAESRFATSLAHTLLGGIAAT